MFPCLFTTIPSVPTLPSHPPSSSNENGLKLIYQKAMKDRRGGKPPSKEDLESVMRGKGREREGEDDGMESCHL